MKKHGHTRDSGKYLSHTYISWLSMKQRCYNKKHDAYERYGGKGIIVCDRWLNSFENFLEDMGERKSKEYSIDRIDYSMGYEPGNCKWSTRKEQARNRRTNRFVTYKGKKYLFTDLASKLNITISMLHSRLANKIELDAEKYNIKNIDLSDIKLEEDRDKNIIMMRENGCTLRQIGEHYGISRQRVKQIIDKSK